MVGRSCLCSIGLQADIQPLSTCLEVGTMWVVGVGNGRLLPRLGNGWEGGTEAGRQSQNCRQVGVGWGRVVHSHPSSTGHTWEWGHPPAAWVVGWGWWVGVVAGLTWHKPSPQRSHQCPSCPVRPPGNGYRSTPVWLKGGW